ncbi:signal transduction histidine kinase [Streptosporangium becharense]|uniref:histidine kinase n=1 Tax=Streptosporangium becharense TaxID=1816182 RepID=A0A7W9IBD6_9ACTN|nr:histidine kinase [Streptosporangium becharense]MBB2915425.1 signal transduction histidine kinase [Streptosporangium becharense]MBB5817612.1 signal transduction histidine kinase [Streptosporangium becharense]
MTTVIRSCRALAGLALGVLSAPAGLAFLLLAGPFTLLPRARPRVLAGAVRLADAEVLRLRLLGEQEVSGYDGRRALRYLAWRWPVGVLGALVLFLLVAGVGSAVLIAWHWLRGEPFDGMAASPPLALYLLVAGSVLLFLEVMGLAGLAGLERRTARKLLGPSPTELLERRVAQLAETRAGVVAAVDQERRRIERDLHDGVQQRLVALAVLIGRARRGRSPELLDDLLHQAHDQARQALADLRDVAWRVYPTALDSLGLRDAVATVAERAGLPVTVHYGLDERPAPQVETAAYFVVCEAVANAAKHGAAGSVTVEIVREGTMIVVCVRDDGRGGADPAGGGLSGLARRVAALDGRFRVDSPPGGPTAVVAELPCG